MSRKSALLGRFKTQRKDKSRAMAKAPNGGSAATKSAVIDDSVYQVQLISCWKSSINAYPLHQRTQLHFACDDEAKRAIGLLWTDELRGCPHALTPDGDVIIPADAVPHFRKATLKFSEHQVES